MPSVVTTSPPSVPAEQQVHEAAQGPLRHGYQRVLGVAKSLYSTVAVDDWVKASLAHLPHQLPAMAAKGSAAVDTVIDRLDVGIQSLEGSVLKPAQAALSNLQANAQLRASSLQGFIMSPAWMQRVEALLRNGEKKEEEVTFKVLYDEAVTAFLVKPYASFEQFAADVRSRVAGWDVRLQAATADFYETAQARIKENVAQPTAILAAMRGAVLEKWERLFVTNAHALQQSALAQLAALEERGSARTVQAKDFVQSLRARLGAAWTESLAEPALALFQEARSRAQRAVVSRSSGLLPAGAVARISGWVSASWSHALVLSQRTVNAVLPSPEEVEQSGEPSSEDAAAPVSTEASEATPSLQSVASVVRSRVRGRVSRLISRARAAAEPALERALASQVASSLSQLLARPQVADLRARATTTAKTSASLASSTWAYLTAAGLSRTPLRLYALVTSPVDADKDKRSELLALASQLVALWAPARELPAVAAPTSDLPASDAAASPAVPAGEADGADMHVQEDAVPL